MTSDDIIAILPFLVLAGAITIVMLAAAFLRRHPIIALLSLAGSVLTFASLWPAAAVAPRQVTPLFAIDGYAIFFMGLMVIAAIAVTLLSYDYLGSHTDQPEEFHLLLLLATLGAVTLVASAHFASFFLGLETLSVSLLGLVGYPRHRPAPVEAGVKYLILAGMSSALLLFGIALVYWQFGTLEFARIAAGQRGMPAGGIYWLTGLALIFAGIGFKLSLVPFHLWAPDVYEGAPAPVTAFIAVVSKGAVFALLLRLFLEGGGYRWGSVGMMINVLAIASMLAGNLLALLQNNVKRLLAYSSIGHLGYLLVAFLAGGPIAVEAVSYYLVAYFVMTLGAFGIVTVLSAANGGGDVAELQSYRGLIWQRPWLGGTFSAMLLALAGIPLTMGFFGKYYAMLAGISAGLWPAVITLVVSSVIGLFYYLRVIVVMCQVAPAEELAPPARLPRAGTATLGVLTILLVWLGVYPTPLIALIRATATQVIGSGM